VHGSVIFLFQIKKLHILVILFSFMQDQVFHVLLVHHSAV